MVKYYTRKSQAYQEKRVTHKKWLSAIGVYKTPLKN
jgi:hypothetical protein